MARRKKPVSRTEQPIAENEQVQELLILLKENKSPSYSEFTKLIGHVSELEQNLSEALGEQSLEANVTALRQRLTGLKDQIVEGCRHILTDFKERGAVALNGITRFLHLKPALEAMKTAAENNIQTCTQTISKVDTFSAEYHQVGHHLKNMGRHAGSRQLR